ncbi:hypothetical protein [Candidatus Regiella insecticola]|uniref:Uncharacterized protein n=1 Tax=Candidatus Regiella insecticola TaxID=138073 RepID=A0A6L2ZP65_9ENTR|nr:hypothetical protein [Candidatus Regiella insecticola]GFN46667.1 uncharacterized protein RINTU1_23750 [Candidatus Regiella insecticola]
MKPKPFSQHVRITFEPSRFSDGQLTDVYEQLTPVKHRVLTPHDQAQNKPHGAHARSTARRRKIL